MRKLFPLFLCIFLLTGCQPQAYSSQTFAMDTLMQFTIYGRNGQEALAHASARIQALEQLFSVTRTQSETYAVNHAQGEWTAVSEELYELAARTLDLCRETGGALDLTAYPAVRAWGFTTGEYRIPDAETLEELAA